MKRHPLPFLLLLLLCVFLLSLFTGSSQTSPGEVLDVLLGKSHDTSLIYIVLQMRLPRAVAALLAGGILAFSGTVFQAVLRNPMADPFVLGVSSGGSLGAAFALVLGLNALTLPAMGGALFCALFVLMVNRSHPSRSRLILTGVALNYLASSLMTLCMVLDSEQYQRILFWTFGSLSLAGWKELALVALLAFGCLLPFTCMTRKLDLLLVDDSSALSMGLDIKRMRIFSVVMASIPVAASVAWFGVIGFVGLLAPHVARILVGPSHKKLLGVSAFLGALLLLSSDIASRILLPSGEMPVGVVTSLLGAPLLIMMLHHSGRVHG